MITAHRRRSPGSGLGPADRRDESARRRRFGGGTGGGGLDAGRLYAFRGGVVRVRDDERRGVQHSQPRCPKDFAPISLMSEQPMFITIAPETGHQNAPGLDRSSEAEARRNFLRGVGPRPAKPSHRRDDPAPDRHQAADGSLFRRPGAGDGRPDGWPCADAHRRWYRADRRHAVRQTARAGRGLRDAPGGIPRSACRGGDHSEFHVGGLARNGRAVRARPSRSYGRSTTICAPFSTTPRCGANSPLSAATRARCRRRTRRSSFRPSSRPGRRCWRNLAPVALPDRQGRECAAR